MASKNPSPENGDLSSAIGAVAQAISTVGDEFSSIKYKIEQMAESIDNLGSLSELSEAIGLSTIATHGDDEDRDAVIEKLKKRYL